MKNQKRLCILLGLIFAAKAYTYPTNNVIEVYNDNTVPCYSVCNPISGLYLEVNGGFSWFSFNLHRPPVLGLIPLFDSEVKVNGLSFVPAIGYDFYPKTRMPLRLEASAFYSDRKFAIDPLFDPDLVSPIVRSDNTFRAYNAMATLYIDWHNCTRFIPFAGVSAGSTELRTSNIPRTDLIIDPTSSGKTTHFSWGGTLGARFMMNCNFYGNIQLRFSELRDIHFRSSPDALLFVTSSDNYLADYVHETSILLGVAYQF